MSILVLSFVVVFVPPLLFVTIPWTIVAFAIAMRGLKWFLIFLGISVVAWAVGSYLLFETLLASDRDVPGPTGFSVALTIICTGIYCLAWLVVCAFVALAAESRRKRRAREAENLL